MFRCVCDRYDRDPKNVYASVEEFLEMCFACFGEKPNLTPGADGFYVAGVKILEEIR